VPVDSHVEGCAQPANNSSVSKCGTPLCTCELRLRWRLHACSWLLLGGLVGGLVRTVTPGCCAVLDAPGDDGGVRSRMFVRDIRY
jgi:hypothetical protein